MDDKLEQAITLIRTGDKAGGQKLLAEVVREEPQNEMAWFWLATVAPAEKRIYCLEKVLAINPTNAQARKALDQLQPAAEAQESERPPAVAAQPARQAAPAPTQYWTIAMRKKLRVILLQGSALIVFDLMPDRLPLVLSQINQTALTKEWFTQNSALGLQAATYQSIAFEQISSVSLLFNTIKITYLDETGKTAILRIGTRKEKVIETLMLAFQKRLGADFERFSKPISRWLVLIAAAIATVIAYFGTRFLYEAVQAATAPHGRGRVLLMQAILEFIGPNGVGVMGFIFILFLLSVAAIFFANPPVETLLVRKETLPH